jgi:hypothetical protein
MSAPLLLVTTAHPSLMTHRDPRDTDRVHPNLGRLIQPRHTSSIELTELERVPWAADNDCFQGLDVDRFYAMLDRIAPIAGTSLERTLADARRSMCKFVTVPDVVGDAVATAREFERWEAGVRRRGLPSALVLQDGVEDLERWMAGVWPRIDAVFVGGSTEWKLGPQAARLAQEAKARGKWVHWGRVNTQRRIDHVIDTGACDSMDGSKWARFRTTYLNDGLEYVRRSQDCHDARGNWLPLLAAAA